MEKDLVDIISEKKYSELSTEELAELQDVCGSEEEYDQMREVFLAMHSLKNETIRPSAKVKNDLDALFDQQYPRAASTWYMSALSVIAPKEKTFFQQPLVRVAAVALLFLMVYPIVNNSLNLEQKEKMAKVDATKNEGDRFVQEEITSEKEESNNQLNQVVGAENYLLDEELLVSDQLALDAVESSRDEVGVMDPAMDASSAFSPKFGSTRFDNTVLAGSADLGSSGFAHPDGVYIPSGNAEKLKSESVAASKAPELLDLLTATF